MRLAGFGWSWIVFGVAAAVVGSGCGASDDGVSSASAGDSSPASPSTQPVAAGSVSPATTETPTGQTAPTVATTSAPTTSAATSTVNTVPSRFTFSGEGIVGVGHSTSVFEAAAVLGVQPQRTSDPAMGSDVSACTGTPEFWTLHDGGLTLVFEGNSESEAVLTNWAYVGGSAAQYEELVAAPDIAIGDRRDELDGAFSSMGEYGDSIDGIEPYFLRFGVDNGVITWFGIVDCAFEGEPAAN